MEDLNKTIDGNQKGPKVINTVMVQKVFVTNWGVTLSALAFGLLMGTALSIYGFMKLPKPSPVKLTEEQVWAKDHTEQVQYARSEWEGLNAKAQDEINRAYYVHNYSK